MRAGRTQIDIPQRVSSRFDLFDDEVGVRECANPRFGEPDVGTGATLVLTERNMVHDRIRREEIGGVAKPALVETGVIRVNLGLTHRAAITPICYRSQALRFSGFILGSS
jgi:hypothetical protein